MRRCYNIGVLNIADIMHFVTTDFLNPHRQKAEREILGKQNVIPVRELTEFTDYGAVGQDPQYSFPFMPFDQARRLYYQNTWVRACIDKIATQISTLEYEILPKDEYVYEFAKEDKNIGRMHLAAKIIRAVLETPNGTFNTFMDLRKQLITDLMTFDAAAIEKVRTKDGRCCGLLAVPGDSVIIDCDEHGLIRKYYQKPATGGIVSPYLESSNVYMNDLRSRYIEFEPTDIMYLKLHPRAGSVYGFSKIFTLVNAIQADLAGDLNLHRYLQTGGVVAGFLTVSDQLDAKNVRRIREMLNRPMRAGYREILPILSGAENAKWQQISTTNREMQLAELQNVIKNKIFAMFSVPPTEFGLSMPGVNRASAFSQQDVYWGSAIQPVTDYLTEILTKEFVAEYDHRLTIVFLPPKERNFSALVVKVQQLDQMGLIDEPQKYKMLGLFEPETVPLQLRERLANLAMSESQAEMAQLQSMISQLTLQNTIEEKEIQHKMMLLQYDEAEMQHMIQSQLAPIQLQATIAELETQLQMLPLQMQTAQTQSAVQQETAGDQVQMSHLQTAGMQIQVEQQSLNLEMMKQQIMQQQQMQQMQLSVEQIVQGLSGGQLTPDDIEEGLQTGAITPEILAEVVKLLKNAAQIKQFMSQGLTVPKPMAPNGEEKSSPVAKSAMIIKSLFTMPKTAEDVANKNPLDDVVGGKSNLVEQLATKAKNRQKLGLFSNDVAGQLKKIANIAQNIGQKGKNGLFGADQIGVDTYAAGELKNAYKLPESSEQQFNKDIGEATDTGFKTTN